MIFFFVNENEKIMKPIKDGNCDALQLEAARRGASRSGLIITRPTMH